MTSFGSRHTAADVDFSTSDTRQLGDTFAGDVYRSAAKGVVTVRTDGYGPATPGATGIQFAFGAVVSIGAAAIRAFGQAVVVDGSVGRNIIDTLTITQTGPGKLSGTGLKAVSGKTGTYRLSGTPVQVTAALEALVFTPGASSKSASASTTFQLTETNNAGAAASTAEVVVAQWPSSLPSLSLAGTYNEIAAGDASIGLVTGDGYDKAVLGNGNDTVQLAGAYDTVAAGNGNDTITEYANPAAGDASPCHDVISLGNGNDSVALSGYRDTIAAGNGQDWIEDTGGEVSITAGSGQDTILVAGTGNRVVLNGSQATVGGGEGSDFISVTGGTDTLTFAGSSNHALITGRATVSIMDLGQALEIDVGSSNQHDVISAGTDSAAILDLLHGAGHYSSVTQVMHALRADGQGNTFLSLGQTGSVEFLGVTPDQLHGSNFKIG